MQLFRRILSRRMDLANPQQPQTQQPAPAQPAPVPPAAPAPVQTAPTSGPRLADAITRLRGGDRAGADSIMRQIVGLPVMPPAAAQPAPGLINRNMLTGPAPGESYKNYMDSLLRSYDPYAIGKNR